MNEDEGILTLGNRQDSLKVLHMALSNLRQYLDHIECYANQGTIDPITISTISGCVRDAEQYLRVLVQNDIGRPLDSAPSDTPQV